MDSIIITSNPNHCCVKEESGLNVDATVRCLVKFEYSINNKSLFESGFGKDAEAVNSALKEKLKGEIDSELPIILAKISESGISSRQLEQSGNEISKKLSEYLPEKWEMTYGVSLSIVEVKSVVSDNQVEMKDGPGMAFNPNDNPVMKEFLKFRADMLDGIATGPKTSVKEASINPETKIKHNFCMNCGAKLSENANFCMECGTKVEK